MNRTNEIEFINLKKAALFIAKLLLRTREGKIQWRIRESVPQPSTETFTARIENDIVATLVRDEKKLTFKLSDLGSVEQISGLQSFKSGNEILSIVLNYPNGKDEGSTPEGIVYRDLEELLQLAKSPKPVSDDLRFKQAMSYLDKLAV